MTDLTERQREVLQFIEQFIDTRCFPPTVREICERFSFNIRAAQDHLAALRKKGYVVRHFGRSRGIGVVRSLGVRNDGFETIPIVGSVAAGKPILAEENIDDYIRVDRNLLRANKDRVYFALRVKGDSMNGAGVMDGDTAIIEKCAVAREGEIVVAWIGERVTLKRFFREKNRVRLEPENPAYLPLYGTDVRIEGRLACVIRKY